MPLKQNWRGVIKYFAIIFFVSIFVIFYVWQNIEIVKTEMHYATLAKKEKQLITDNDRLLYEIERYRNMDLIGDFARRNGLRSIRPDDFDVLDIDGAYGK